MKLPKISSWTAVVVIAGIAGVCAMVALDADTVKMGAYSTAFIFLAGGLQKLFPGDDKKDEEAEKTPPTTKSPEIPVTHDTEEDRLP